MKITYLFIVSLAVVSVNCSCPNNCNGHGICRLGKCECFDFGFFEGKSYTGNDCSLYKCESGNPFSISLSNIQLNTNSRLRELDSVNGNRYLTDTIENGDRELLEIDMKVEGSALDGVDGGRLYKVSGLGYISKYLPKTGGTIECNTEFNKVEIVGINEDKTSGYILLEKAIDLKTSIIKCNKIISKRRSMVNYGNMTVVEDGILKWENYGIILKEMGVLTLNENSVYVNNNFSFGCFSPPNPIITIYDNIEGNYSESNNKDLVFTINNVKAGDICYCIMSSDVKQITIENTELSNYIKKNNSNYELGKYIRQPESGNRFDEDENGKLILLSTDDELVIVNDISNITMPKLSITFAGNNKIVYTDVIRNGVIIEKEVKIIDRAEKQLVSNDGDNFIVGDMLLPYIKYHSSNPLKDVKPIVVMCYSASLCFIDGLPEPLILQFEIDYGGLLKCKFNNSDIILDLKRYNDFHLNHFIYTTVLFPDSINVSVKSDISSLKCNRVLYRRNDLSIYNPVLAEKDKNIPYEYIFAWNKDIIPSMNLYNMTSTQFACVSNNEWNSRRVTIYNVHHFAPDDEHKTYNFSVSTKKDISGDMCFLLGNYTLSEKVYPVDFSKSDLFNHVRKEDGYYYYGRIVLNNFKQTKCERNNKKGDLLCVSNEHQFVDDAIIIIEDHLEKNDLIYFRANQTIYVEMLMDKYIPFYHKAKITSYEDQQLKFTPPIISGYNASYIFVIPNPVNHMRLLKTLNSTNNIYKLSDFYDNLLNQFENNLGGKIQCYFAERDAQNEIISNEMRIIDVKGYKRDVIIDYGYFEFDNLTNNISENEKIEGFHFKDVDCGEIILKRNDMSLLNPIQINEKENYDRINHRLKWKNYIEILSDIVDKFLLSSVSFGCYNENDSSNKKMKIYNEITIESLYNDIIFVFNENNEPNDEDICFLLCDENGKVINIESSDLYEFVRKEDDGYYYGKKDDNNDEEEEEKKNKIIRNLDGSITQIIQSDSIINEEEDESNKEKTKDKLNIINMNKQESPSILYPPILINEELKQYFVLGTKVDVIINNGKIQTSQIINIIYREKINKFELMLNKPIDYFNSRILYNELFLPSITIILHYKNEGSIHKPLECSGQGICNRENGLCECYKGYSGNACQRLNCPNNCNGNGICVSLSELLSNEELSNNYNGFGNRHESELINENENENGNKNRNELNGYVEFANQVYGCLCDKKHRGYDCSLVECPSGVDPEGVSNDKRNANSEYRDCSGRGICNYESGICECFDGFSGEGCQLMTGLM